MNDLFLDSIMRGRCPMTEPAKTTAVDDARKVIPERWRERYDYVKSCDVRSNLSEVADSCRDYTTLIEEISDLETQLRQAQQRFDDHTKHVSQFLSEMYAVMIDPLDSSDLKVAEMTATLLDAAKRDRETANMHADALGALQAQLRQEREAVAELREERNTFHAQQELERTQAQVAQLQTTISQLRDELDQAIRFRNTDAAAQTQPKETPEHDWVPNVLSDKGGNVCRECGLVSEADSPGSKCSPHKTFQGIPGFPRKRAQP